jgi:hypothetical protein
MADQIPIVDPTSGRALNAVVELFDPPMCCPTGLCGPTVDQTLLDVSGMILALQSTGVRVERCQMSSNPNAFLNNPDAMRLVREQQMAALPDNGVHRQVLKAGAYPTLAEVMDLLKEFAPEFAQNQIDEKALVFQHPNYQAAPAKYKLLIGIAAAAISRRRSMTRSAMRCACYHLTREVIA